MYAWIRNNKVQLISPDNTLSGADYLIVEAPNYVEIGWNYDDGVFRLHPDQIANKCKLVDVERDRRLAEDYAYDFGSIPAIDGQGNTVAAGIRSLQMTPADRANWQTLYSLATVSVLTGSPDAIMPMRCEDNFNVLVTAQQTLNVLTAATLRGSDILLYGASLKDQLRNAANPNSIDIYSGWPT